MTEQSPKAMRELYPEIEPYDTGTLPVSDIHTLYYEQSGNPSGKPVIFIHGGPGSATTARDRRFFNPLSYRIVLMDQRGAGKSTPTAEIKENTTWHILDDIERLREHLNVESWVVFGTSWGSTVSLLYTQANPHRVKALIIQGIFTITKRENDWFYKDGGANRIFPDVYEEFMKPIPEVERFDLLSAYHRRLSCGDEKVQRECTKAFNKWELVLGRLRTDPEQIAKQEENDEWATQIARLECHYFVHGGFLETDTHIMDNVYKIRHIPTTIIQGRYDVLCPMDTAWKLHKAFPEAEFIIVPDAGHSGSEVGTCSELVTAADKYKDV